MLIGWPTWIFVLESSPGRLEGVNRPVFALFPAVALAGNLVRQVGVQRASLEVEKWPWMPTCDFKCPLPNESAEAQGVERPGLDRRETGFNQLLFDRRGRSTGEGDCEDPVGICSLGHKPTGPVLETKGLARPRPGEDPDEAGLRIYDLALNASQAGLGRWRRP